MKLTESFLKALVEEEVRKLMLAEEEEEEDKKEKKEVEIRKPESKSDFRPIVQMIHLVNDGDLEKSKLDKALDKYCKQNPEQEEKARAKVERMLNKKGD
jgi:hypothetical protein